MTSPKKATKAATTPSSSQRLGREDWVEAALRAMAVSGLGGLSVERLATELGATKGSFYWHFKDRSALIEATLTEWERRDTDRLIERASHIDNPRDRLLWLFRVVFSDTAGVGIDVALLADADDPVVAAALERVAAKRIRYIEAQYKLLGSRSSSDRAVLTYTAFVGLAQLRGSTPSLAPQGRGSSRYLNNITKWLVD